MRKQNCSATFASTPHCMSVSYLRYAALRAKTTGQNDSQSKTVPPKFRALRRLPVSLKRTISSHKKAFDTENEASALVQGADN